MEEKIVFKENSKTKKKKNKYGSKDWYGPALGPSWNNKTKGKETNNTKKLYCNPT